MVLQCVKYKRTQAFGHSNGIDGRSTRLIRDQRQLPKVLASDTAGKLHLRMIQLASRGL